MIWDIGNDYILSEQQRTFDEQRGLVVKKVLPPSDRDKLRDHEPGVGYRLASE